MKSKKVGLFLIGALIILTLAWAGWQFLKPKNQDNFAQKEISIKQADIADISTLTYQDWSGFEFGYPSILAVKEVELEDPRIYSSLELSGNDGKKLTLRVTEAASSSLSDWQKQFLQTNSVRKIDQTQLADLPALRLQFGAPEMMLTVAIESGIIYEVQSPVDTAFWDRTHLDLVSSFKFTNLAGAESAQTSSSQGETIILVEETIE